MKRIIAYRKEGRQVEMLFLRSLKNKIHWTSSRTFILGVKAILSNGNIKIVIEARSDAFVVKGIKEK